MRRPYELGAMAPSSMSTIVQDGQGIGRGMANYEMCYHFHENRHPIVIWNHEPVHLETHAGECIAEGSRFIRDARYRPNPMLIAVP